MSIRFYQEAFLIQSFIKTADEPHFMTGLLSKVKDYFSAHIDPNDKANSVLNALAPGAISITLSALGFGKWALLAGLAAEYFHLDVSSFLKSIWDKVKSLISNNQPTTSAKIDAIVDDSINQYSNNKSASILSNDARLISLALDLHEKQFLKLSQQPQTLISFASRAQTTSLLGKIFGWVIKVALASAGLMVASDMIHKWMGDPTPLDNSTPINHQSKYHPTSDQNLPSSISMPNSENNIKNLLLQWTKDIYPDLSSKDNLIQSSPAFKTVLNHFYWNNINNQGQNIVFVPSEFKTKKSVVDLFIDDIANRDA